MPTEWTDEQRLAIDARGKGITVPAAAGSGKTTVLVERVINILADPANNITPDRLLAVTFTTDAASNMKRKLSAEFEKRIANNPDDQWLQSQQSMLASAKIKTINAFCLDFVKENFNQLDIRDDVKIIEPDDEGILLDKSIEEALEEAYNNEPEMMKQLNDSLCQETDEQLINHIKKMCYVLGSVPFPESFAQAQKEMFTTDKGIKHYTDMLFEYAKSQLSRVRADIVSNNALLKTFSFIPKLCDNLNDDIDFMTRFIDVIESKDMALLHKLFDGHTWARLYNNTGKSIDKTFDTNESQIYHKAYEHFKTERDAYKMLIDRLGGMLNIDMAVEKKRVSFAGELYAGICSLTLRTRELLWEKKLEQNAVSFADVEDMTVRLLVEKTESGYKRTALCDDIVSSKLYKMILIDEFQDVNDLQELIFKALSDTDDLDIMGTNVFIVGDVKQAIYGFRQANPKLFLNAIAASNVDENSAKLEQIRLRTNFRSRINVIDFVNDVFGAIMSDEVGDVAYDSDEMLYLGAKYPAADIPTDILYFSYGNVNDESDESGDDDNDGGSSYGELVPEHIAAANYIRDMIDKGTTVYDHEEKKLRPCRPSDFCILVRTNKVQSKIASALKTVGLDSYYETAEGYMRAREIFVIINLMRVIDSPFNDVAMLSVMLSQVMGFTADEVTTIRLLCDDSESGVRKKLYQTINAISKDDSEDNEHEAGKIKVDDPDLEEKCKKAIALIKSLRYYAASMPLEALIGKIYEMTDLYSSAAVFENSSQMRANLRMLIEYAAAYDSSGSSGGLTGFLRYYEKIAEAGKDFKQAAPNTAGEGVIIQTMHGSKGLEYPFIILCDMEYKFKGKGDLPAFLIDRDIGAALRYHNVYDLSNGSNLSYDAMSLMLCKKELSEEMRLLYVAMTRAQERLCVILPVKVGAKKNDFKTFGKLLTAVETLGGVDAGLVSSCGSYAEWIVTALATHEGFAPFIHFIEQNLENEFNIKPVYYCSVLDVRPADIEVRDNSIPDYIPRPANTALVEQLIKGFDAQKDSEQLGVISKLSVTEIVRAEQEKLYGSHDPEFYPRLPRLDDEIGRLTHAERGTYTHLFMELADYTKAQMSVKDELERLTALGMFSKKEAQGVYINALEMFFASTFYKRMAASPTIMREKSFLTTIDELELGEDFEEYEGTDACVQGIADCIFEEADGYVIVDYKTDRFENEQAMDKYKTQLRIYKAAFDLILDKPVKSCYIYSFWLGKGREMIF